MLGPGNTATSKIGAGQVYMKLVALSKEMVGKRQPRCRVVGL